VQRTPLSSLAPRLVRPFVVAFGLFMAFPVLAADPNVERQAQALQKKAIEEDNLNLNYAAAIKKLATAISKCGEDKCAASLKGALYRDLGAMLILSGSADDGRAAFAKALSIDSSLELDAAYKSPALEGVWVDVKKKGGAGGAEGGSSGPGVPPSTGTPASGDFAHVPAGVQSVRTPLPVYAEYLGTEKLSRVVVKYKGAGMTEWKAVDLRKMDGGYGGVVPCKDVAEGSIQYYIQGYGASDDAIAASGSRAKPYTVAIKGELSGPAPSLPGQDPPKQCTESEASGGIDCPPDFPGCHTAKKTSGDTCTKNGQCESGSCNDGKCAEKKEEGEDCEANAECRGTCSDGKCTAAKKQSGDSCDNDDDCAGVKCQDGKCSDSDGATSKKVSKVWIGLGASLDLVVLPSASDVCKLTVPTKGSPAPVNGAGYECVDPSTGANYPGTSVTVNQSIRLGAGDSVAGGFAVGNLRLVASIDYALTMNVLVGARAGYVLFTDPASAPGPLFAPIHLEARFTYLFGKDALTKHLVPMIIVAAGAGEFDAAFPVQVLTTTGPNPRNENAWLVAGPIFAAAGGGLRYLFQQNLAATVAIKGQAAFGGAAGFLGGFAPEVGVQLGL
jgi:hypothetical protein